MNRTAVAFVLILASPAVFGQQAHTILKDNTVIRLVRDGRSTTSKEMLVRIDTAAGGRDNRRQQIRFDSQRERAKLLAAYIEHANGKRRVIAASAVRVAGVPVVKEIESRDDRLLTIPYPRLRRGDKFYFKVLIRQQRAAISGGYADYWLGPWPQPTQHTVTIDRPEAMAMRMQARGFRAEALKAAPGRIVTRWVFEGGNNHLEVGAADTFAFRDMLAVSTYVSYADVARVFDRAQQRQAKASPRVAELARELVAGVDDPLSKALAIHTWIRRHIRYHGLYFSTGEMLPLRSAESILQSRFGDCKDHVVLMEAMLAAVGLDSTPALISWGNELFTLPEVPYGYFNHVITYLPALDLYLDASSKDIEGGYLPEGQLDKPVLLIRSGALAHTPAHQAGQVEKHFEVQVHADGSAAYSDHVHISGHLAETRRAIVRNASAADQKQWMKTIFEQNGWRGSADASYEDVQRYSGDFRFANTNGEIRNFLPPGDLVMLPARSAMVGDIAGALEDVALDTTRTQPFRCEQRDIREQTSYTLPKTLAVEALPEDVQLQDEFFDYSAHYARTEHGVRIERHLLTHQSGSLLCAPGLYAKATVAAMRKDLDSQIVLRRLDQPAPP